MIKVKVSKSSLLNSLQRIANVIRDNRAIPAASGVFFEVRNEVMEIRGTDLDITMVDKIEVESEGSGSFVVKPSTLIEYLKELSEDSLEIKYEGNAILIATAHSSTSFSTYSSNDFPNTYNFEGNISKDISVDILTEGIEKTILGASSHNDNLALSCVRIEIASTLKMVTNDAYRLFYYENKDVQSDPEIKVSLPLKTANILLRILKAERINKCTISMSKNQICFFLDKLTILSKIVNLPYIDYEKFISSQSSTVEVTCETNEIIGALRRVHLFARENIDTRNGAIFSFEDETLKIDAFSEISKIEEVVPIKKLGNNMKISLNVKFMLDFLNQIDDKFSLKMKNKDSSVLLSKKGQSNFKCVVMPFLLPAAYR